jgi:AraC-like DNA-binding protein
MTGLPLQHFRRAAAQYAATPEIRALLLANTGVDPERLTAPDFELTAPVLWQLCANMRAAFGPGWHFQFPALWSLDVQGDLEAAMRFAPTLGDMLRLVERYGNARWPLAEWQLGRSGSQFELTSRRTEFVPQPDWQMLGVIFGMNTRTVLEVAFPDAVDLLTLGIEGPSPIPEASAEALLGQAITWNARKHIAKLPLELASMPSNLADPRSFAALTHALEAQLGRPMQSWRVRVENLLGDSIETRPAGSELAARLGLSLRTLERHLAREGTSLRQLRDQSGRAMFESLLRGPGMGLAAVAARLGYCDESALSRATRRWYGCTAAEARRRLAGKS